MSVKKHIVIIGAGFGGLKLARKLNNHPQYEVTLIDRNNYHQFQPLFYQVATANLEASNISFPLRDIFRGSENVRIRVAEVISMDTEKNILKTSNGDIDYDYLVVATGAMTNYFGNENIKRNAFPMKSTLEALELRNQLTKNFEDASLSNDKETTESLLNIVIVGGGPTGIELSGALAEMKKHSLPKEYPEIDFRKMNIYLLEGSDKVLGTMSKPASAKAKKYLLKMGVHVKTNTLVKDYDGEKITLDDKSSIRSALVIWAAGVIGNMPAGIDKNIIAPGNRIKVNVYNKVEGFENIYAIGDIAWMASEKYPKGFPQLANVAIDQARNLGGNFKRMLEGRELKPFSYFSKGSMATVGRNKAVVDLEIPRISFQGFAAWVVWMSLHLYLLIGIKNRILVFIQWAYNYITQSQSLALLLKPLLRKSRN